MLKKTITYENPFTDQPVTETHYFHISKADLVSMELEEHKEIYTNKDGVEFTGMAAKLQRISEAEDGKAIIAEIKDFIRRSYGIRDGDHFRKSVEIWEDFSSTEAFSQLLFDLTTDAGMAAQFVNGVVPKNLEQIADEVKKRAEQARAAEALKTKEPTPEPEPAADPTGLTEPTPEANQDNATDVNNERQARIREIAEATPDSPIEVTQAEMQEMDYQVFKAGLADGRYKLS